MDIEFENPRHEKLANNFHALAKKYDKKGQINAENIRTALDALQAAPTLADVPPYFRPHPMKGRGKGLFTVDVDDTHRVVFESRSLEQECQLDSPQTIKAINIHDLFFKRHK